METAVELTNSEPTMPDLTNVNQSTDNMGPQNSNHGEAETKVSAEEMRNIITVMAATGKFWHDWLFLRSLLSELLKQVMAEYPEAQRSSLSGETYNDLVLRLDEALLSFEEGPPFTLQRLCEILLSPKSTYSHLSKLALALEKNLLVTSTLTRCTEAYPKIYLTIPTSSEQQPEQQTEESTLVVPVPLPVGPAPPLETKPGPNGVEATTDGQPIAGDTDEEMPDAEPETEPKIEEQNPNPSDVEMQDMEEKTTQEEENVVQEEEKVTNDENSAAPTDQTDSASVGSAGEEAVTADKVDPPSVEPVVEP